jgi:hypothetical protein
MLNAAARTVIESGALAHLVTINDDGSAQVAVVWVGLDGDELVSAPLDGRQKKLANIRRDPRVVVPFEAEGANAIGMRSYLVVHDRARITAGALPSCCTPSRRHMSGRGPRSLPCPTHRQASSLTSPSPASVAWVPGLDRSASR